MVFSVNNYNSFRECLQDGRLQWFGQVERMEESAWCRICRTFKCSVSFPRQRPRKTLNELLTNDPKESRVNKDLGNDRMQTWKTC